MQSGYVREYPLQYTNYPSQYEGYDQISYGYPSNISYSMASSGAGQAGSTYDKICMYYCIEPRCPAHYSIILQDYTSGTLSEDDINRLVDINTGFKCPAHEASLTRAYVRVQWEIPENTILSRSVELAHRTKDKKKHILCPEKGCGALFKTKSDFKRHLAAIFRPFYCLRGNCCIDGRPCRRGFGRIEEVISHLRNENGQHHDAVRYRPVEGWDFRRKTPAETQEVLEGMEFISEEELYDHYRRQEQQDEQYYY
ncbi:hypothetical protein TWF696_001466 [Orbilia brochopaga]|uniref:C2H2-type domain-containing protein n=1 Tax=Orbilia brochopaga TaxID=3140254 RepID=A0AAV9UCA7_9PEZI